MDDDELTEPEPDSSFFKKQTLTQFLQSASSTDRERVHRQMQRTSKAPFFGKLADRAEREIIRKRDVHAYGGNLSASDSVSRMVRFHELLEEAKNGRTMDGYFIKETDKALDALLAEGRKSKSLNISYQGGTLRGVLEYPTPGDLKVHIYSITIPHDMRGDDTIGKYIDYYLHKVNASMDIHTIVGPGMAAIAFNRGFHVYDTEDISNYKDEQHDIEQHALKSKVWHYNHSDLNDLLVQKRTPVKFIDLRYPKGPARIQDPNRLEMKRRILQGPAMLRSMEEAADRSRPDYTWELDPSNPDSGIATSYRMAGLDNPFMPRQ